MVKDNTHQEKEDNNVIAIRLTNLLFCKLIVTWFAVVVRRSTYGMARLCSGLFEANRMVSRHPIGHQL